MEMAPDKTQDSGVKVILMS